MLESDQSATLLNFQVFCWPSIYTKGTDKVERNGMSFESNAEIPFLAYIRAFYREASDKLRLVHGYHDMSLSQP
jgi:hypothetical protein